MLIEHFVILFLEGSKSYGIIPNGLKIKKGACIGNVRTLLLLGIWNWQKQRGSVNGNFDFGTCVETLRNRGRFWFTFQASHSTGRLASSNKKSFGKVGKSKTLEKTQEAP